VIVFRRDEGLRVLEEADELDSEGVPPHLRLRVGDLFTLPGQPEGG
jgi:hypothetical protein